MRITERRLRSIIRNVIKESIKAETLDLSSLVNIGIINPEEKSDIESKISESLEEGILSIGKIGGIVAAAILAITICNGISSTMQKTRSDLANQRRIDTQGIELAIKSKGDLQGAYDDYKGIVRKANSGDDQALYELEMIHAGLNSCGQFEVLHSRDVSHRHPSYPQQNDNPTNSIYRGEVTHRVDRLDMDNDPQYAGNMQEIRNLCLEFSYAAENTEHFLKNNPNALKP